MIKAIYKITNNINRKIYIGQSVHPRKRWWEHCQRAKTHADNYPIHLAINKYGEDNFSFEILEWTEDFDNREKELIQKFDSLSPKGYNVLIGGAAPIMRGEQHPRNTVSDVVLYQVIAELKENKKSDREIAKMYNLSDKIVADINHGYTHKIESESYPLRIKKGKQKLTIQEVEEIKNLLLNSNQSYSIIAKQYGVSKGAIYHINTGRTFVDKNTSYPIRKVN